jgi:DNA-binding MarR family transcriptional regulator
VVRVRRPFTTVPEMTNPGSGIEDTSSAPVASRVDWTFLTNHAHVLLAIARDQHVTLRETAARVGITERAAQNIVADLVAAGYLTRTRQGRRNSYTIQANRPLRHRMNAGHDLDELLDLLTPDQRQRPLS